MPYNLPQPPSGVTGELRTYLVQIVKAINATPVFSWGSFATPNSNVSGPKGDFFVNLGSASTHTRVWMKVGPDNGTVSNMSWDAIRVLPS